MSDFRDLDRRDPIQRDPVYDALGERPGKDLKDLRAEAYGSGPFWGWVVGFLVVAGILLLAYSGSEMRTAQYEPGTPPARITPAPSPVPAPLVPAPAPGTPPSPVR